MRFQIPYFIRCAVFALFLAGSCFILTRGALDLAAGLSSPDAAYTAVKFSPAGQEDESAAPHPLMVIDPGHGGEDGGASSAGVLEKDINLAVCEKLGDLCTVFGLPALLTRTGDTLLYDAYGDLEDYTGKQKTYDLRNRLRMAEESGASVFLSVHQNQFPQSKVRGMQVYYSSNDPASEELARRIRVSGRGLLDPGNDREIKAATNSIYVLHRIRIPAVLAECGFLSNPEERELLASPDYQQRVAAALFVPAAEFLAGREE